MDRSTSENLNRWSLVVTPGTTLLPTLLGSVLCWLAFPPVAWGLLAWIAPIPWLVLALQPQLPGKKPYLSLWFGGFVFWLLAVHWIRLPHPLNHLALLALASYLGFYLPLFVALCRSAVHQWRVPLWLAAPIAWTGLDWFRGQLMTGFLMGSVAHTQVEYPLIIQIADLTGEYGVTFLIILVAATIANSLKVVLSTDDPRIVRPLLHLLPAIAALSGAIAYGTSREDKVDANPQASIRVALIQGNTLADWKADIEKQQQIMDEYSQLSFDAVRRSRKDEGREVDLVVWPETAFRQSLVTRVEGYVPPEERIPAFTFSLGQSALADLVDHLGTAMLVGVDRVHVFQGESGEPDFSSYNSSALADRQGTIVGSYDKMHRVPFGEYIPFSEWIPSLNELSPLTGSILAGESPTNLRLGDVLLCPNICYETVVPHLIREHVRHAVDTEHVQPTALVNLTNDAWYWGSSELDMHLACGIFRAVEMRTPLLIAANGGLSAHVDIRGHVVQVTERQRTGFLLVDLPLSDGLVGYPSFYAKWGDWFAGLCVVCCLVLAAPPRSVWGTARRASRGDAAV